MYQDYLPPEDDRERFTAGDCHVLAMAIARKTGWQTAAFLGESGIPDVHAFVLTPDGDVLDIDGKRPVQAVLDEWQEQEIVPAAFGDLRKFHAQYNAQGLKLKRRAPRFGHTSYQRARVLADQLITEVLSEA